MSIQILKAKCVGCSRCVESCPGNLLKLGEDQRAFIRHPEDCWGCTACLKACFTGAIRYYLGADIGGRGSTLSIRQQGRVHIWTATAPDGATCTIRVDSRDANEY